MFDPASMFTSNYAYSNTPIFGYQNLDKNFISDYANLIQKQSEQLWAREDSAYQRMVEDMKKAGLNPWTGVASGGLSAGSNVPALDSLTGLLNALTYNLDTRKLDLETNKALYGVVDKGIDRIHEMLSSVLNGLMHIL